MKTFTLALAFLLIAPLAHADGEDCSSNPNVCSVWQQCSASAGFKCVSTSTACTPSCGLFSDCEVGTCEPMSTSQTSNPSTSQTQQSGGVSNGQTQQTGGISNGQTNSSGGLLNPLSAGTSLQTLLTDILGFVIRIGVVVVVLMLVYVGFMFATAGGNESQITKAREALLWTIVGALILLGAQAIASGIQATANALSTGS